MPKKKTATKSSKKIESMSQTDGMALDENKFEPSTLDQVFGDDGVSKYKTLNDDVYGQVLDNMSKADLKAEAIRVGLLPIDNIAQLRARLSREFSAHVSSYKRPKVNIQAPDQLSEDSRKILEEGM